MEIKEALDIAIKGQTFLRSRWEGEYGYGYPQEVRTVQIKHINNTIDELKELKNEL